MALTSTGLTIPTLQELKDQIASDLQTNLGVPLDTSETAVAGIINAIFAASISNSYELLEAIYTQRTLEGAEGLNLDDLVAYTNIVRLAAASSRTDKAHFIGTEGANIPQNAVASNPSTGDRYLVESPVTITSVNCYKVVYSVNSILNSTAYTISVNGSAFTYTSDVDATADEILTGLETAFSGSAGYSVTKVGTTLEIVSGFIDVPLEVSATTFLVADEITTIGVLVAESTGEVSGAVNSITKIISPVNGWTGVTNPEAVIVGRDRETDDELRIRQQESLSISNKATPDAITSFLRSLSGVTAAFIVENDTSFIDGDLRPPKSYEAIVSGGTDQDIAQALWDSKPIGIETVGDITEEATDIDGFNHPVKFSRPVDVYVHVEVSYTLYDEEAFPSTGEDSMKTAILETAANLDVNEDVIPKRFYGNIYANVAGIQDLTVAMTTTTDLPGSPSGYTENTIPINFKQIASFALNRITVITP